MVSRFLLWVLFSAAALAGSTDPVLQAVFTNQATAPANSEALRNRGQQQHLATVRLVDAPSQTCAGGFIDVRFEARDPGAADWFTIGTPLTSITTDQYGQLVGTVEAQEIHKDVRLTVNSFDTTNCRLYATYAGAAEPRTSRPLPLLYPLQVVGDTETYNNVASANVIQATGYTVHRLYYDLSACTGGDSANTAAQLQAAFDDNGPWFAIGQISTDSTLTTATQNAAVGEFPLIRAWLINTSATGCATTVYYSGSNEALGDIAPIRPYSLVHTNTTASNTVQIVAGVANVNKTIVGLALNNPCAAGTAAVATISGPQYFAVGPGSSLVLPITGATYATSLAGEGWEIRGNALTAGCTAWVTAYLTEQVIP